MTGVFTDPFFAIPTDEAKLCLTGARDIMQAFREPTELHLKFSSWCVTSVSAVVHSAMNHNQLYKEKLWINFHELTVSAVFAKRWEELLPR